jgi:hypothetical protein
MGKKSRINKLVTVSEQGVRQLQERIAKHKKVAARLEEEGIVAEQADIVCYPDGKLMWKPSDIVTPFYIYRTDGKVSVCVDPKGRIIGVVTRL